MSFADREGRQEGAGRALLRTEATHRLCWTVVIYARAQEGAGSDVAGGPASSVLVSPA